MKRFIVYLIILTVAISCDSSRQSKIEQPIEDQTPLAQQPEIPILTVKYNPKYGTEEEFLSNHGFPSGSLTLVGCWVLNLGSPQLPVRDMLCLYKHDKTGEYYMYNKYEDGSMSIQKAKLKKSGSAYDFESIDKSFERYVIEGNILRMIDDDFPDQIVTKGVFYEDQL